MKGLKYFLLTLLVFSPAICVEIYMQLKYYSSDDIMFIYKSLSGIEEAEIFRNIFFLIGFIVFLFISRLRLEYLNKSTKNIFFFFFPGINILFLLYLIVIKPKNISQN